MHKSTDVRRADVAADDTIVVHDNVGIHLALIVAVVGDLHGVSCGRLSLITGQIKPLLLLNLVVIGKDAVKFGWNDHLLDLNGLRLDLPAELGKK